MSSRYRSKQAASSRYRKAVPTGRGSRRPVLKRRGWPLVLLSALVAGCGGAPPPATPAKSTTERTLKDPDGDAQLSAAPGEPLIDRGAERDPGRALITFAQMTDLHVRDEESPSRVPYLDRYAEPFQPTFRPQEALSAQVAAAAIRAVNRAKPEVVLVTGDLTDNAQRNELAWTKTLLDGGRVVPDSGAPGYRGVQQADDPDPFYYRPGVDPPRHPDLLAQAQRPVTSPGLDAPWWGVPGNHDVLLQGELRPDARTDAIATGDRLVTSLDPRAQLPRAATTRAAVDALLGAARSGRSINVPADADRASASNAGIVSALTRGRPTRTAARADYVVDRGPDVRFVLLDLTSRLGGQAPVIDPDQLAWLDDELDTGRTTVLVTHQRAPEEVLQVLDRHANVVLALHGDSHRNRIDPRGRYWVVGTSSLADYPMQSRIVRLREHAIETWMVDEDGRGLAGTARELAFIDPQGGRPEGYAGARDDRNARLYLP